mmetsp:Transcript_58092/g.137041  ORF Transcript_58092/g.137041 Transcript_58092/m.137041 type:complete len:339 (-) Transcript_58092:1636-2652(-)
MHHVAPGYLHAPLPVQWRHPGVDLAEERLEAVDPVLPEPREVGPAHQMLEGEVGVGLRQRLPRIRENAQPLARHLRRQALPHRPEQIELDGSVLDVRVALHVDEAQELEARPSSRLMFWRLAAPLPLCVFLEEQAVLRHEFDQPEARLDGFYPSGSREAEHGDLALFRPVLLRGVLGVVRLQRPLVLVRHHVTPEVEEDEVEEYLARNGPLRIRHRVPLMKCVAAEVDNRDHVVLELRVAPRASAAVPRVQTHRQGLHEVSVVRRVVELRRNQRRAQKEKRALRELTSLRPVVPTTRRNAHQMLRRRLPPRDLIVRPLGEERDGQLARPRLFVLQRER